MAPLQGVLRRAGAARQAPPGLGTPGRRLAAAEQQAAAAYRGYEARVAELEAEKAELERRMAGYRPVVHGDAPPFWGGLVGYLAYDAVRQFEPTIGAAPPDDLGVPDAVDEVPLRTVTGPVVARPGLPKLVGRRELSDRRGVRHGELRERTDGGLSVQVAQSEPERATHGEH